MVTVTVMVVVVVVVVVMMMDRGLELVVIERVLLLLRVIVLGDVVETGEW
jgi:hypothetical protein